MSQSDWGRPGYQGRPDPTNITNALMRVVLLLFCLGFLSAGFKLGWFNEALYILNSV